MVFPCYLAMTASEFAHAAPIPPRMAWMACHFSPSGPGLSNCPEALPEGAIVILDDSTPIHGHDPALIVRQLAEVTEAREALGVLLDFQRPGQPEASGLAQALAAGLLCPVAVSRLYADGLTCPVFLPPVPHHCRLADYLAPWAGREVWLEAALDGERITVTAEGAKIAAMPPGALPELALADPALHCHYAVALQEDAARFVLGRTEEDLAALLQEAESLGVAVAVGLYQELADI